MKTQYLVHFVLHNRFATLFSFFVLMLLSSFRIHKTVIILNRSVHVAVHLVLPLSHRVQNLGMIVALEIIVNIV